MDERDVEDFGPWLGRQLRRNGMSQSELAERLGLTRAAVSAWITGRAQPRTEILREIAEVLGTDTATVLTRTTDATAARPIIWYHRPAHADGGREYGNAAAFAFDSDLAVLAREATQNSLDEKLPGKAVRVRYTLHELTGEHLNSFLDALQWNKLEPHFEAAAQARQKVGRVLVEGLRELRDRNSLVLLRIDDYNAAGLTGPEYGDGRFAAVVRRQLDSHKRTTGAGGSYGLGKATIWSASKLGLVLINSTLSEAHEGRTERRMIGRLELPWRTVDGEAYAGPAWLGEAETEKDFSGVARSWWADGETASALQLEREGTDPGTSFLVVGVHDADDEVDTLPAMHEKLVSALADNFWAAMTSGSSDVPLLEASVRSLKNGTVLLPEQNVDPRRLHPAQCRALQAYFDHETVPELTGADQVAMATVRLTVPPKRQAPAGAKPVHHDAVLLLTPADPAQEQDHSRLISMRGNRMKISAHRPRDLGLGTPPFQAILLAGLAAGDDTPEARLAEEFLRASEPPEHNSWGKTEELTATYARGALSRIREFPEAVDEEVRKLIGRRPAPDAQGPAALRELLKLDGLPSRNTAPRRHEGHPTVRSADGRVDSTGAWVVRVFLRIPERADPWRLTPVAKFDARFGGGLMVGWAELTAVENCRIVDGIVLVDPGVRTATFSGVTAVDTHLVPAHMASLAIDVQRAAKETA